MDQPESAFQLWMSFIEVRLAASVGHGLSICGALFEVLEPLNTAKEPSIRVLSLKPERLALQDQEAFHNTKQKQKYS